LTFALLCFALLCFFFFFLLNHINHPNVIPWYDVLLSSSTSIRNERPRTLVHRWRCLTFTRIVCCRISRILRDHR
jgi:hypothetical protein